MKDCKHAIITGAGSGLGHGLATRMLGRSTRVSVLDLAVSDDRRAELDAAAEQGASAWQFVEADVTNETRMRAAVDEAAEAFGPPGLALNCAGYGLSRAFADMDSRDFRRVIEINLFGSHNFAAAAFPHLQAGARLAFMASMAGLVGNYGYAAYGSSKFGVVGLATVLRTEWEPRGIRVSLICPPEVKTPLVSAEHETGDPVGLEMKQLAGSLEADAACDKILAGLDSGRWLIVPGVSAKLTALVSQHIPGLFQLAGDKLVRRAMRKHGVEMIN